MYNAPMNDEHTAQLWDARRKIVAKDEPLNDKERAHLAAINRTLESDKIDMTDKGLKIDSNLMITALQQVISFHTNMYKLNRNTDPNKAEDHLIDMYYAVHVFAIEVNTAICRGGQTQRFCNVSSNAVLQVSEFIRNELDIMDVSDDPRFSWVHEKNR